MYVHSFKAYRINCNNTKIEMKNERNDMDTSTSL